MRVWTMILGQAAASTTPDITALQRAINDVSTRMGLPLIRVDGVIGNETLTAYRAIQQRLGVAQATSSRSLAASAGPATEQLMELVRRLDAAKQVQPQQMLSVSGFRCSGGGCFPATASASLEAKRLHSAMNLVADAIDRWAAVLGVPRIGARIAVVDTIGKHSVRMYEQLLAHPLVEAAGGVQTVPAEQLAQQVTEFANALERLAQQIVERGRTEMARRTQAQMPPPAPVPQVPAPPVPPVPQVPAPPPAPTEMGPTVSPAGGTGWILAAGLGVAAAFGALAIAVARAPRTREVD
jgi:lysozyme family protein